MLPTPHSPPLTRLVAPWSPMIGHALTVIAPALGAVVVSCMRAERRAAVEPHALMNLEAEHSRRAEPSRDELDRRHGAEWQQVREEIRDLRSRRRQRKQSLGKGDRP